jgi:opacity protein-like surface antigen
MRRVLRACACVLALLIVSPRSAAADVLLTPFAGVSFLEEGNEKLVYGASLAFGGLIGVEAELGRSTLGRVEVPRTPVDLEAALTTAMVNLVVRVPAGPIQPYATGGLGVIRVSGDVAVPLLGSVLSLSGQDFGLNVGGGVFVFPSRHLGLRADVRYFRTLGDLTIEKLADIGNLGLPVPSFDFWRATGGVTLRF